MLVLNPPSQRREINPQIRPVEHDFLTRRAIVEHDGARAVGADEELMAGFEGVFSAHVLAFDAIHQENPLRGER